MPGFFDKVLGKDARGKVQAIGYLGNMRDDASRKRLVGFLEDESPDVRRAAAAALEQHFPGGGPEAMAALAKALGDPDAGVRKNAARSLGGFIARSAPSAARGDAMGALAGLLEKETDAGVIANAVAGLAASGDPSLAGPIAGALRGKGTRAVVSAIDAIDNLPPTDAGAAMKKELRSLL